MSNLIISLIIFIIIFIIFVYIQIKNEFINIIDYKKRQSYADRHERYTVILDYYLDKAFEIIYKDKILIYSIEGTKPDDEDIKQYSKEFTKLTLKLLGSTLIEEFVYLYGDEDTFIFIIIEYFNTKAEHDEIKQASIDQIMEGGSNNEII